MYHLVLLMPLLALVLFWILPLAVALPAYIDCLYPDLYISAENHGPAGDHRPTGFAGRNL